MKSVFKTIICLVLCVSLILGWFPQKAEASVTAAVTIGVAACLLLMTAGVVFNPRTVEDVKAIGQSFQDYMYDWGSKNNKQKEVESYIESITILSFGSMKPQDPDDKVMKVAEYLLEAVTGWIYAIGMKQLQIPSTEGTGFIISDTNNFSVSEQWARSLDIYSLANGAKPGSFLLLGGNNQYLDNVTMWYGCSVLYNANMGINVLNLCFVEGLSKYTNLNYPVGSFVNYSSTALKNIGLTVFLNYDNALSFYEKHVDGSYQFSDDYIYYLCGDTKIVPKLQTSGSRDWYCISLESLGRIKLSNGTVSTCSVTPSLRYSTGISSHVSYGIIPAEIYMDPFFVGDPLQELEKNVQEALSKDIYFGEFISDYMEPLVSLQQISQQMIAGDVTVEEYQQTIAGGHGPADRPSFVMNIPLGSSLTYTVGSVASPIEIIASVTDGGTLTYEWTRYGQREDGVYYGIEVLSTSSSFVPLTNEAGWSVYHCTVKNTDKDGFVSYNYSNSIKVTVVEDPTAEPDATEPTIPVNPEYNQDLADKIGASVSDALSESFKDSMKDSADSEYQAGAQTGQDGVNQIIDIIPDYSTSVMPGLQKLATAMSYTETKCVLTLPAIKVPAIGNLMPETTYLDSRDVNLEDYFNKLPESIIVIIRAFFDISLVFFCLREVKNLIGNALTGFQQSKSKEE